MHRLSAAVLAAASVLTVSAPALAAAPVNIDAAVLAEVNLARTAPAEYAKRLSQDAARVQLPGESPRDVAEAVRFLASQKPLPPLSPDGKLAQAARSHAVPQGQAGQVGHVSPNGATLSHRLEINGLRPGMAAENISYGYSNPREVVRQLIVDSGVPDRGHRVNIFTADYQAAGVSCAPHREWGALCVIDFADAPSRR